MINSSRVGSEAEWLGNRYSNHRGVEELGAAQQRDSEARGGG